MIMIPEELCADLVGHLELIVRGAIPSPERGAELLRRLKFAITAAGRGFVPTEDEQHTEVYRDAPPPRE
jgi:hypothetical protein